MNLQPWPSSGNPSLSGGGGANPLSNPDPPVVLVIVPTRNAAGTLGRALASLVSTRYPGLSVVVVDGGSIDTTRQISERYGAAFIAGELPRGTARRVGAAYRESDYLLFLDSDQEVSNRLIQACVQTSLETGCGAIRVPERDETWGFWAPCRRLDRRVAGAPEISYPRFIATREYWRAGGHDSRVQNFMEDRALYLRLVQASVRFESVKEPITNILGNVQPLELGRKGAATASDAGQYYRTGERNKERLLTVIRPRLRILLEGSPLREEGVLAALLLPLYWLLAYGPRFVRAGLGSLGVRHRT